jgi:hypothetical protein
MPDTGKDELRVMLCSGSGPVEVLLQPASGEDGHSLPGDNDQRHDPCPYGLALGKALDPAGVALPLPVQQTASLLATPMPGAARQAAMRGIRPPARGPPLFA